MHGTKNIKFATAQQAKQIYQYKKIKEKLYKSSATTWYNKTCRKKQLTPKYISFKINGTNHQCLNTIKAATHYCINQELKFLYIKKNT
jgi:hypothetical protein